jgi:hypothetical protein
VTAAGLDTARVVPHTGSLVQMQLDTVLAGPDSGLTAGLLSILLVAILPR